MMRVHFDRRAAIHKYYVLKGLKPEKYSLKHRHPLEPKLVLFNLDGSIEHIPDAKHLLLTEKATDSSWPAGDILPQLQRNSRK